MIVAFELPLREAGVDLLGLKGSGGSCCRGVGVEVGFIFHLPSPRRSVSCQCSSNLGEKWRSVAFGQQSDTSHLEGFDPGSE